MRVPVCLSVFLAATILLLWGALFHDEPVYPGDPNDRTASSASEFALNRMVAGGSLFRDPARRLRVQSAAACPT